MVINPAPHQSYPWQGRGWRFTPCQEFPQPSKYLKIHNLPMTGFELQTSSIGSNRFTNWASTTALNIPRVFFKKNGPLPAFFSFFVFSTQLTVNKCFDKSLPMTGFKPRISDVWGDRSTTESQPLPYHQNILSTILSIQNRKVLLCFHDYVALYLKNYFKNNWMITNSTGQAIFM